VIEMREVNIISKLEELECSVSNLSLGDFDAIGELTARKARGKDNPLYKTAGCFFRPNYERGMLAYALVKKYRPKSILEIGFGRGYWSVCAAKAMYDFDIDGSIMSIDQQFDSAHIERLSKHFPHEWLSKIQMLKGNSSEILSNLDTTGWDLVYIDGDHTYAGVSADWNAVKDKCGIVLFDDYHKPTKNEKDIEVARLIDELQYDKELILMDRLVFCDDRSLSTDRDYGQVLMKVNEDRLPKTATYEYNW